TSTTTWMGTRSRTRAASLGSSRAGSAADPRALSDSGGGAYDSMNAPDGDPGHAGRSTRRRAARVATGPAFARSGPPVVSSNGSVVSLYSSGVSVWYSVYFQGVARTWA